MVKFSNEHILPHTLTSKQEQVVIGGMLGDASFELAKNSKYPRMKIDRQFADKKYLEWEFEIFRNLCTDTAFKELERYDARYNKINKQVSFRTRAVPAFLPIYEKWYPNKKKTIPNDLELTPLICAVWFADDGCIVNTGKRSLTLKIATDGFGYEGAKLLAYKLEKILECKFPIYHKTQKLGLKNPNLWFIKAATKPAVNFIKYIEQELKFMGMDRKIDKWRNLDINSYDLNNFLAWSKSV